MNVDLSIIIVSWNVKDLLRNCLKSVLENSGNLKLEIFVVDNASKDESVAMIKKKFPTVNLIANQENLGFSKANNLAIKQSTGRFVLLLNPDMRVTPETLPQMVEFMEKHPTAGIAGCHLVNDSGVTVPHVRRFPTVWDQAAIILKLPHLFPFLTSKYLMKDFDYNTLLANVVDSIRGSFFMIRRELIDKIGGLDERYFIWFEEVDYCKEALKAGFKVMYNPKVKCVDYVGQSFKQVMSYKKQQMFTDSMVKYFKKWHAGWQSNIISLLRPVGLAITYFLAGLKK